MPTGDFPERLKLEGILQYAQEKTGVKWNLKLDIGSLVGRLLKGETKSSYDGIIAYVQSSRERKDILRIGLPTVLIEDLGIPQQPHAQERVASIVCDHFAEGATAARYFLDRHYENFAFVGTDQRTAWSDLRRDGYASSLKKAGFSCHVYKASEELTSWISGLPTPCAVFAARDLRARQVLDAADDAKRAVPQDIAVLGVDNDEILCMTSSPALSSIPTFDRSLGFAAGRALNQLLMRKTSGGVIQTRNSQVVSRRSTDADAVPDPFVAHALAWARTHLAQPLDVKSLAGAIHYSAKELSARTRRTLGASVSDAIRLMRVNAARELLENTEDTVAEIADACGFSNVSHLSLRIKEATGLTPLAYRRRQSLPQVLHRVTPQCYSASDTVPD